jgi:hypothetical protein
MAAPADAHACFVSREPGRLANLLLPLRARSRVPVADARRASEVLRRQMVKRWTGFPGYPLDYLWPR